MSLEVYKLAIDGPLFRRQRQLLIKLATSARQDCGVPVDALDLDLLKGLVNLTDAIADQALDRHGMDCRLDE